MDEQAVREHAQAHADALLAGDIGKASEQMSKELHATLGQFASMLPMPMTEASGERATLRLETRRNDRDGTPTIVEASRVHEEPATPPRDSEATEDGDP